MQLPQVGRVLPGPAGKLQELAAAGALQQATPELLGLKASSTAGVSPSQAANQYDAAFLSSSWAAAKARAEEDAVTAGPVRSVTSAKQLGLGKVSRMLLLLSSFHPSGAGSAFSKVKDPSGAMGAAIHASALQEQPLLGPGCVMLLQDVSVLTPHPGSCYLAVTAENIVQVWGPDQQPRSIRHTAHQPAGTQHPQQQQHAPEQQQHMREQLPQRPTQNQQPPQRTQQQQPQPTQQQHQQQPGQFLKGHPQPRPGTAAAAAAAESGADSRHSGSFFEPPSPDVMSVLNQLSSKGPGGATGIRSTAGATLPQPQQRQQQHLWQKQGCEQQGEVSPALSGAAGPPMRRQTGPGSMPPPPPRAPAVAAAAAGGHHASQQQQQRLHNSSQQQQPWMQQSSQQQQWPASGSQQQQQQPWMQPSSQGQQQQPAGVGGPTQHVQQPLQQQGQGQGQSLFQGLSQPMAGVPGHLSSSQTLNPGSSGIGAGSQVAGAWPGSSRQQGGMAGAAAATAGGGGAGTRGLPGRPSSVAAAAACDEEDVEVDENIVSAIFGSQVPRARPPQHVAPQQQQQSSAVSGALTSGHGRAHAPEVPPAPSGIKPALTAISILGSQQQGAMRPPAKAPAQQQWGMQQQQQAGGASGGVLGRGGVSGGVLGKGGAGVFGGSLLGKRPAMSLLDDLVADELDDF